MSINDYNFGICSESEVLDKLREHFHANLEIIEYKFSLFDFQAQDILVELKTRKCTKNKYESTMIGCNKLIDAEKKIKDIPNLKIYYVFRFTDCLTYWQFTPDKMKQLPIRKGGRNDRNKKEEGLYFYIDIKDLINI